MKNPGDKVWWIGGWPNKKVAATVLRTSRIGDTLVYIIKVEGGGIGSIQEAMPYQLRKREADGEAV